MHHEWCNASYYAIAVRSMRQICRSTARALSIDTFAVDRHSKKGVDLLCYLMCLGGGQPFSHKLQSLMVGIFEKKMVVSSIYSLEVGNNRWVFENVN